MSNTLTFNLIYSNVSESVLEDRTNRVNACGFRYHLQKFVAKQKRHDMIQYARRNRPTDPDTEIQMMYLLGQQQARMNGYHA